MFHFYLSFADYSTDCPGDLCSSNAEPARCYDISANTMSYAEGITYCTQSLNVRPHDVRKWADYSHVKTLHSGRSNMRMQIRTSIFIGSWWMHMAKYPNATSCANAACDHLVYFTSTDEPFVYADSLMPLT